MGSQFERKLLLEMINTLQDKLVLIDEAYVEFADYSLISDDDQSNQTIKIYRVRTFHHSLLGL